MSASTKYALVTGASSGIGWHISKELAMRGYSIVAVSNQPKQLEELKKELEQSFHISVYTFSIDLSKADAAKQVFNFCESKNISVEVLVNNAGILVFGEAARVEYEKAETILHLHMNTPALLCRLFGEKMIEKKAGFILNVSSISAVMPYPGISLYGPTKTFIRKFSRALRTEMKVYSIHVTCLLPGATATALYDPEKVNIPLAIKLGVMKKPDVVARAGVKALFSNRAECIPGLVNKLVIILFPLIPQFIIALIHRRTNIIEKAS